jgi:hypothetical protein
MKCTKLHITKRTCWFTTLDRISVRFKRFHIRPSSIVGSSTFSSFTKSVSLLGSWARSQRVASTQFLLRTICPFNSLTVSPAGPFVGIDPLTDIAKNSKKPARCWKSRWCFLWIGWQLLIFRKDQSHLILIQLLIQEYTKCWRLALKPLEVHLDQRRIIYSSGTILLSCTVICSLCAMKWKYRNFPTTESSNS